MILSPDQEESASSTEATLAGGVGLTLFSLLWLPFHPAPPPAVT